MWITNRTCLKKLLGKQNNAESLIHQKNWRVEQPVHSIKKGSIARFRYFRSEITNYLVLFLPIYIPHLIAVIKGILTVMEFRAILKVIFIFSALFYSYFLIAVRN